MAIEVMTKESFSRAMSVLEQALALKKDINPIKKTITINPDDWEDGESDSDPKYCELVVNELEEHSTIELSISDSLSDIDYYNQLKVLERAEICRIKQDGTLVTLVCYGQKPTIDISIDLLIQ